MTVSGAAHVAWLSSQTAQRMAWPVDGGLMFRQRRLFGDNKRVSGFFVLPIAASLSFWVFAALWARLPGEVPAMIWPLSTGGYALLGFACGLAFLVAELPNSFLKRQIGIAPGEVSSSPGVRFFTMALDRFDSVLGCLLVVSLIVPVSLATWLWVLVLGVATHALFSVAMYRLGLKGRAM